MIEIEILNSKDLNRLGTYFFNRNRLNIGASLKNDIIVNKEKNEPATLEISADGRLYITPSTVDELKVNSNKTNARKTLKENDLVDIGDTKIKICAFHYIEEKEIAGVLNNRLSQLKENKSPFLKILKLLKE